MAKRERRQSTNRQSTIRQQVREKVLEYAFYCAYYDDAAEVSLPELIAAASAGALPPDRFYSSAEFLEHASANRLVPSKFDPVGYRISHRELWGAGRPDWEPMVHYVKNGSECLWTRPFDPGFYRDVYFPEIGCPPVGWLDAHRAQNPNGYGSLEEALVINGWSDGAWIEAFDYRSYLCNNNLTERFRSKLPALVHFIETGWREGLAISPDLEFDPAYYSDLAGIPMMSVADGYRIWIEQGLAARAPANETHHLRDLGLDLIRYPETFDWKAYIDEVGLSASETDDSRVGRWQALGHFAERGALAGALSAIAPAGRSELLLAVGDKFARAARGKEALLIYERALLLPDPSPKLMQHAADQARRSDNHARAVGLYREVRNAGHATIWTYRNATKSAIAVGDLDGAVDWITLGLKSHSCDHELWESLFTIQRARYDRAIAGHRRALSAGRESSQVIRQLNAIFDSFLAAREVEYGRPVTPPDLQDGRPLRVAMLANRDLQQCTHYRVSLKQEQLRQAHQIDLAVYDRSDVEAFISAVPTAHLAIFYRLASNVEILNAIAACRALCIPTIYEIDDLVFDPNEFPDSFESYLGAVSEDEYLNLRSGVSLFRHAASCCDFGLTSTDGLAEHLQQIVRSGKVTVHRNGLSPALAQIARSSSPRAPGSGDASPITLFYGSGTRAHGAEFADILAPALDRLLSRYDHVRLVLCGHVQAGGLPTKFGYRVSCIPVLEDLDAYLAQFFNVDINLAVLKPTPFNDCKSEIKWLEPAAFCVPSVVSDVRGFRETLTEGRDVILAPPESADWFRLLEKLVLHPDLRSKIGHAARQRALEYEPAVLGRTLAKSLWALVPPRSTEAVSARPRTEVHVAPRRRRILLTNVFFPPQALGGATRVVSDQATELVRRYSQEFEVGVLCGNIEPIAPYQTQAYDWGTVRVWSISSPYKEHMDWLPFDPSMAAPIDEVLDYYNPSLVHAHCIQRLTATLLERVAIRGIPYVVTVHDAWWISDHQFLTDYADRLRMPWDSEEYESDFNPHSRQISLARRMGLKRVLGGARAVLAVSEPFANVYRHAGISNVEVVRNAVPTLPPLVPTQPIPGRVRLAHLGGLMKFKGYHLLRDAIRRAQLNNVDLLVIDHNLPPWDERHEVWGTTPVRIVGLVPQAQVGALYGQFDVLCALSLWPESFGLVVREALHYGKWVIVSSLGALAEDVVPGRNGWVVDVTDPDQLRQRLQEIDAQPDRFAHPTGLVLDERATSVQTDETVSVYRRVLRPLSDPSARETEQLQRDVKAVPTGRTKRAAA